MYRVQSIVKMCMINEVRYALYAVYSEEAYIVHCSSILMA